MASFWYFDDTELILHKYIYIFKQDITLYLLADFCVLFDTTVQ